VRLSREAGDLYQVEAMLGNDPAAMARLWQTSADLVGMKPAIS